MKAIRWNVIGLFSLVLGSLGVYQWPLASVSSDFDILRGYVAERVLAPSLNSPLALAINSSGDIVVTDQEGQGVYQVHEDGSVTEYIDPISSPHHAVAFDLADNLYVSTGDGIWKITPAGAATKLADEIIWSEMEVSSSGDLFTVGGSEIHRITPDGQVSVYASGLDNINDLAINPITGELYVADWNAASILKVNPDGSTTPLATDLPNSVGYITFSSTGILYYNNSGGELGVMSTVDGSVTNWPWATSGQGVECGIHHGTIRVDNLDRIVAVDSIRDHIIRYDPISETIEILVKENTNSTSLAVAPDGSGTFIGVIHPLCNGKGEVQRINMDGTSTVIVDDLPSSMNSIAFDSTGLGYAATGGQLYSFTALGGTSLLISESIGPQNLAVNPQNDVVWGADGDELWRLGVGNQRITTGYPFTQTMGTPGLAFTPDGELYLFACEQKDSDPPQPGIYHFTPFDSSFTLILDMTELAGGACTGILTAGADGNLYWLLSDLVQITPDGVATVIGETHAYAPEALASDPNSADLYFTSATGVYRLSEASMVFLPLVVNE